MKNLLKGKIKDTLNIGLVSLEGDKEISIMKNFLEFVFAFEGKIKINTIVIDSFTSFILSAKSKSLDLLLFSDSSENCEEYLVAAKKTEIIDSARLSNMPKIFFGAWSLIGWLKNRHISSIVTGVVGHDKREHRMETDKGELFLIPSNHKELMIPFKRDRVVANSANFLSDSYVTEEALPFDYVEPEIITVFNKEEKGLFFQYDLKPLMSEPKFSEALNYTAFLIINSLIKNNNE